MIGEIDRVAGDDARYPQEFLSERLANAGLLPMFGFPSRARQLYLRKPRFPDEIGDSGVSRSLEIAVGQFAPGSETVKDKAVHTAVGLVHYVREAGKVAEKDGKGDEFPVGTCRRCGALSDPVAAAAAGVVDRCQVCGTGKGDDYRVATAWQPLGFAVQYDCGERDFNGSFDYAPAAGSPRIDSTELKPFRQVSGTNLERHAADADVVVLNDNGGALFEFHKLANRPIQIVREALPNPQHERWRVDEASGVEVALGARTRTDVLLLRLTTVPDAYALSPFEGDSVYARAAYHSLGELLRTAACDYLDVEHPELRVNVRPMQTDDGPRFELFLMDALENGAGYCRHLAEENVIRDKLLPRLVDQASDFRKTLERHASDCDGACTDCVRRYDNAELHGLLDWRLGLDLARLLADPDAELDFGPPYWSGMAEKAAARLARVLGDARVEALEGLPAVWSGDRLRAVIAHPLWSGRHRVHREPRRGKLPTTNPFDVFRRTGWVVARLLGGVGSASSE